MANGRGCPVLVTRVCESVFLYVCLFVPRRIPTLLHARTQMYVGAMVGVPSSCALLGGSAIGVRVSLLW